MKNKKNYPIRFMDLYFFLLENGKALIGAMLFLSVIIVLFFLVNNLRSFRVSMFHCTSECEIIAIQKNKEISQGLEGGTVRTSSYSIAFTYVINEKIYRNKNIVSMGLANSFYNYKNVRYTVKYDCANPQNSFIVVE